MKWLLALTAALAASNASAGSAKKTAQGAMIDIKNSTDVAIVVNTVYTFDKVLAATYFNNVHNASAVSCIGNPTTDCASANMPAAPAIPPPSQVEVENFAYLQRCLFLDGGQLSASRLYRQDIVLPGLNGRGNWQFENEYFISPAVTDIAALTAWSVYTSGNPNATSAPISLNAEFAGLSAVQQRNNTKYTFSLRNNDGSSRVRGIRVYLNGVQVAAPSSTLQENCPGCGPTSSGAVDFLFNANAGTKGNTALLKNGDARSILNTDSVSNNDNGGSSGRDLAKAVMTPVNLNLPLGINQVRITAKIKDVNSDVESDFSVTKQITVDAQGCSAP